MGVGMSQAHVLQPIPIDGLHPIILSCTITAHIIALLLKINSTTPHTQPPPGRIGGTPPTNRHMIRFTFVATPHSYVWSSLAKVYTMACLVKTEPSVLSRVEGATALPLMFIAIV